MIRIAQVANSGYAVRLLLLDQIERLRQEGYEVEVVCGDDQFVPELRARGLPLQVIPLAREPSPARDLSALVALRELFVRRRYRVVHSHTPKPGLLAPFAARLAGTPVILHTVHGLLFHDRSRLHEKLLGGAAELWTARLSHRLLSQSSEDMQVAARLGLRSQDRLFYLGNGIDVARFSRSSVAGARERLRAELGFEDSHVVVGMAGRLVREKGFVELFDALARAMSIDPHLRALVIGLQDAEQSDALDPESLLRRVDRSRVRLLGKRSDMPEIYSAMDLFAMPSYREGIPRALMEASAMELPVIASDIRGCREVVIDGQTGLLTPPRQAATLADAIVRLASSAGERRAFGAAGRRHIVSVFDANLVLDRLADYYRKYVGAFKRPS